MLADRSVTSFVLDLIVSCDIEDRIVGLRQIIEKSCKAFSIVRDLSVNSSIDTKQTNGIQRRTKIKFDNNT